jgi:NAD+ kinase
VRRATQPRAGRRPWRSRRGGRLESSGVTSVDGGHIARVGVVVHPTRDISRPLASLRAWAGQHRAELVQLARVPDGPHVAPDGDAAATQVVVAVGGDGTVLAALRAAAASSRPVIGVACGSLGALTTVAGSALTGALDDFAAGRWAAHRVPALHARDTAGSEATAINDLVVVRAGGNQVGVEMEVDGVLYGRFSGDGVIASTQVGSSAYGLAAGGPILAPGSGAWAITPLAPHGGSLPPIVLGARSRARLHVAPGFAGVRVEVDGRTAELASAVIDLDLRPDFGTLVRVGEEEHFLTGLRRRRILLDSPRMMAREARQAHVAGRHP